MLFIGFLDRLIRRCFEHVDCKRLEAHIYCETRNLVNLILTTYK